MKIYTISDNIFDVKADVLINPVNLVGVMGKGLALEFKNRFPDNYIAYKKWCKGKPKIGECLVFGDRGKLIFNFPTKIHWKDPSDIEYIEKSARTLVAWCKRYGNKKKIAVPKVGCGLGGLDWNTVKPKLVKILSELDNIDIEIIFLG